LKHSSFKTAVIAVLFVLVSGTAAFAVDAGAVTIEVCHGGFIPLDHANGMVFAVRVISDTPVTVENLTIDTRWWDSIHTLHYPHATHGAVVTSEIACQNTPDMIFITGASGTIGGIPYDLTGNIRVVSPDEMGIDPVDYMVKPLIVTTE